MSTSNDAVSRDPTTGKILAHYPFDDAARVTAVLARSAAGYIQWRVTPLTLRADAMRRIARGLRARKNDFATLISQEMGKPIVQARGEVEKCAALCEFYAEQAATMLAPEPTLVEDGKAMIEFRPLGPVLAVMPWNFPIWQALRGAVPILIAGNSFVFKPAPNVMGCAYLLDEVIREADLPDGVFTVLNATPEAISTVIADPRIAAVTVTGSVRAGAAIAAQAGAVVKKCVLELGGSDPFIVLADADLDLAVDAALKGRFQNTGQVCAASKRLIIEASISETFKQKFVAAAEALVVGNPLEDETYIGPMARFDLRDELHRQVEKSVGEGAKLLLGGKLLRGEGNYYAPTVLAEVTPSMTAFKEELFGPVAVLITARDAEHALMLANDSDYGLSSTIWSADVAHAKQMAARLETGNVFINGYSASDQRVAFGGVKKSGYGRELSHYGMREFCNAQTVWIDRR